MSELQLIAITHESYQHYKKQGEIIIKLNLQIDALKNQHQETSVLKDRNKQLSQENCQLREKTKALSKEVMRLARGTLQKEEIIQEMNQKVKQLTHQRDQNVRFYQYQIIKITRQLTSQKQKLEQELKNSTQMGLLLQRKVSEAEEKTLTKQQQLQKLKEVNNSLEQHLTTQLSKLQKMILVKMQGTEQFSQRQLQQKQQNMIECERQFKRKIDQIQIQKKKLEQELTNLKEQLIIRELQQNCAKSQVQKQQNYAKKLEEEIKVLKLAQDELESCQGEIMIYRIQLRKIQTKLQSNQLKLEELVQENRILADQNKAWKLMITEQYYSRWQELVGSKCFSLQLKDKKYLFGCCKYLLLKYMQNLKSQILSNLEEDQGQIILKMQIQNLLNQFEQEISLKNFKQLV